MHLTIGIAILAETIFELITQHVNDIWYFLLDAQIIGYFATLLALARAEITGPGAAAVAVSQQPAATVIRAENYNSHPRYSFGYRVADGLTGNILAMQFVDIYGPFNFNWHNSKSNAI